MNIVQKKNWDQYWSNTKTQRFTKLSWSKKRIIQVLSPYIIPGKNVLDAGCGSGFFSLFFCQKGLMTTALDYSESALDLVHKKSQGQIKIIKADLLKDQIEKKVHQKFDIIFTDGLFEHFSAKQQDLILINLLSVLCPEGVIVTFVPNRWSPWQWIRPFFMPGIKEVPFLLDELVQMNERNHLSVSSKGGINTFPFSVSPDQWLGHVFGMLLYTIAKKRVSDK